VAKQKYTLNPPEIYDIVMKLRSKPRTGPKKIKQYLDEHGIQCSSGAIRGWIYSNKKPFLLRKIKQISESSKELTHEKAYILGTLCGDAYTSTEYRIGLSVCDKEFAEYFKYCLETVYEVKCSISSRIRKFTNKCNNPKKQYQIMLCSKLVLEDLKKYSNSFNSKEWKVPIQIKEASKEIQAAFIRGFADSEGHVRCRKGQSEINLCSGNLLGIKMIKEILLKQFQINSYLGDNGSKVPVIVLTRYESIKKFYDKIGFVTKRKQDNLRKALNSYKRKGLRNYNEGFKHLAMYLLKQGFKHGEIAKLLKTSRTNIYDWENRLKF